MPLTKSRHKSFPSPEGSLMFPFHSHIHFPNSPRDFMDHQQADQYIHYGSTKRRRERRGKWVESFFEEIMAKKFPNLSKDMDRQIQETQ